MNMNYDRLTLDELRDAAAVALAQHRAAACGNLRAEIAELYCGLCDLITERLEIEQSLRMCLC